jgi:Tol biopolymer transport system component
MPVTSNDGSKIYARGVMPRGELVRFDRSSKQFRPFLQGISAEYVDFSRDGNWVAYVTFPDGILWKARRDGSNALQLTRPPLYPLWPKWSPDGSLILFTNAPDDLGPGCAPWMVMPDDAYVISSDGGPLRRLLPGRKEPIMYPEWSPDGRKIVFATCSACKAGNQSDWKIAILDVASGMVTTIPGSDGTYLARWSPEGRRIFAMAIAEKSKSRLYDLTTSRWTKLDLGYAPSFPAWSHDGRYIYYAGSFFDAAIMRVLVTGGKPEPVASIRGISFTGWFGLWMGLDPDEAPLWLRDTGTDELYALTLVRK